MNINCYNKQLKLGDRCKSSSVEIVKNENSVGVMYATCGNLFAFENPKVSLSEVVEWWNKHYGQD